MTEKPTKELPLNEENDDDDIRCTKIQLWENINAYIEKRETTRDIEVLNCNVNLLEKITSNYVIVKKIIRNLPWQDKMLCKHVCSMWHSAVHALQKEQLSPVDFVINLRRSSLKNRIQLVKSMNSYNEPMVIFTFASSSAYGIATKCEALGPCPCEPFCHKEHCLIDVIQQHIVTPKNCMLTVKSGYLTYMPVPTSITIPYVITYKVNTICNPLIAGVYIPVIPNVEYHVIKIKSQSNMQKDFYEVVDKLAQDRLIKGVLVYVTDSYLLRTVEDIVFLNYFKDVQPNVPYALGGCLIEDSITDKNEVDAMIQKMNEDKDYVSENLVTMGLFTAPKTLNDTQQDSAYNFDMFSLILESSDWSKAKIQATINEFSKKIPKFEYSVALKLSCVGRDLKHENEQAYFRMAFPNTPLVGCYGNGELGLNHPPRPRPEEPANCVKRHRRDSGPQFGIMYSYSTVFLYFGWGKILAQPQST